MKIFEFQFNPKAKKDRFFRVFSFNPPPEMPERGSIYIVGELTNALPINSTLLDRLAAVLQQEYYESERATKQSASQRLKSALKKANGFLAEESKKGNVDWLGNLHFLLLLFVPVVREDGSIAPGYTLYFAKVGDVKLWMARSGSLVDAGKSIETAKKDDGSSKVFGNVGSGKVVAQDRIIAFTQETFNHFSKENFLQTLVQLKEEKQFTSLFKSKAKEMSSVSGILLFVLIEDWQPDKVKKENKQSLPILNLKLPSILLKVPQFSLASTSFQGWWQKVKKKPVFFMVSEGKKRVGLFTLLLFVLFLGVAIIGDPTDQTIYTQEVSRQKEMDERLQIPPTMTEIAEPEVVAELHTSLVEENLQRMIKVGSRFYFFQPGAQNISFLDIVTNTSETLNVGKKIRLGTSFENSLFFFAEPDTIVSIDQQNTVLQHTFVPFSADVQFEGMEQFEGSLYFFDSRAGEIFKSGIPSTTKQVTFERWVNPLSPKKPLNARSMSIDGNIWILTSTNEIQKYFRGQYVESLDLAVLPAFQNATLLKASLELPYLYILEPFHKRLVILDKSGGLIEQYYSEVFARVRDFTISADGQTIHLFTGAKIYLISPSY